MAKKRKNKKKKNKKKKKKTFQTEVQLLGSRIDDQSNAGHIVIQVYRIRKDLLSVLDQLEERCKELFDSNEKLQKSLASILIDTQTSIQFYFTLTGGSTIFAGLRFGCLKSLAFSVTMMILFWCGSFMMLSSFYRGIKSLNWSIQHLRRHCRILEAELKSFRTQMNQKIEPNDVVVDCTPDVDLRIDHIQQHSRSLQILVHPKLVFFAILTVTVVIGLLMPTVAFVGCCND